MLELRDLREMIKHFLNERNIETWIYENAAGARPGTIVETSLREVEATDIYIGLLGWFIIG